MVRTRKLFTVPVMLGFLLAANVSPVAAAVTFSAECGFQISSSAGGANVRSDAITDSNVQAQNIYVHSEFYRDGVFLGNFNDDGVNRSHAEAFGSWNFSFGFEHPTYRVKSWHNIRVAGVWKTQKFCDLSWQKP